MMVICFAFPQAKNDVDTQVKVVLLYFSVYCEYGKELHDVWGRSCEVQKDGNTMDPAL